MVWKFEVLDSHSVIRPTVYDHNINTREVDPILTKRNVDGEASVMYFQ